MRILDKIKQIFNKLLGRTEQKLLSQPQQRTYQYGENFNRNINNQEMNQFLKQDNKFRQDLKCQSIAPQGIDFAIEQYINSLIYQKQNNMKINSYNALVTLGRTQAEVDNMAVLKESNLVNEMKNRPDIDLQETYANDGRVSFYHVSKNRQPSTNYRLYLNCKNKNVPDLVKSMVRELENLDSFYFKFNPQSQSQFVSRSEQLVFYSADEQNLNKLVDSIKRVRMREPHLFEGSKNGNPFLKKVDGYIAYAPQPQMGSYRMLDGTEKTIPKSYNSLLSGALEDSFVHSIRDMVSTDSRLSNNMNLRYSTTAEPYIQNAIERVWKDEGLKSKLINNMKMNLEKATQNNRELDIVGIGKNKDTAKDINR